MRYSEPPRTSLGHLTSQIWDTEISTDATPPEETYAYDLQEIQTTLAVLPERTALAFAIDALVGYDVVRFRDTLPQSGPIFRNAKGGLMDPNNILNREILPVLNRCAECHKPEDKHRRSDHEYNRDESLPLWHGWHAGRRGLATNLAELGIDEKLIQRILRHSNANVTKSFYIKARRQEGGVGVGRA